MNDIGYLFKFMSEYATHNEIIYETGMWIA